MSNFINDPTREYQVIPKGVILDYSLSDKARFLYCFISAQREDWVFSPSSLCEMLGYSDATVKKYLGELFDSGWVEYIIADNGEKVLNLKTSRFIEMPRIKFADIEEDAQNISNDEKFTVVSKQESDKMFEECWVAYRRKGCKNIARKRWDNLKPADKQKVVNHIPFYVESCSDRQFQKDFERYLGHRVFENVVYANNVEIYNPDKSSGSNVYHPKLDGYNLIWNEKLQVYIAMYDLSMLVDGYTNNNRPDGAFVSRQGIRYRWSAETKKWEKYGMEIT